MSYFTENRGRYLEELKEFLRIPSISTLPEHKEDIRKAARFVADRLRQAGMEGVDLIEGEGNPLVYGEWTEARGSPRCCYTDTTTCNPPNRSRNGSRRRSNRQFAERISTPVERPMTKVCC